MKICFIRKKYSKYGGAERYIDALIQEFLHRGFNIHLVTEEWSDCSNNDNIHIHPVNPLKGLSVLTVKSFNRIASAIVGKISPDIIFNCERVVTGGIYRAGDGCHRAFMELRAKTMNVLNKKILYSNPLHNAILNIEEDLFKKADVILANSRMVENDISTHYPFAKNKITVMYNAIPRIERFLKCDNRIRARRRSELGVKNSETLFLYVGSGFKRKGLLTLIDGAAILKDTSPLHNFKILVVGKDRPERYIKITEKKNVLERFIFAGGRPDTLSDYLACDIFVLPTIYDPCSNATLEALAAGRYVITTETNGAGELIKNNITGKVLPSPLSPPYLAGAMEEEIGKFRRQEECERIQSTVAHLTMENYLDKLIPIITR